MKSVKQIGRVVTGNIASQSNPSYFVPSIDWVKMDNLLENTYAVGRSTEQLSPAGRAVARVAPAGSLLVACIAGSPASIGRAAVADREVAFNQQINAICPFEDEVCYLYYLFRVGRRIIQDASTNSMKGIVSKSKLEDVFLPVPPLMMQQRFLALIEAIHHAKAAQQSAFAAVDTLFASLQHSSFSGDGCERKAAGAKP